MKKQIDTSAMIAAFVAKGKAVTVVPAGERAFPHMTNSDWYRASQSTTKLATTDQDAIAERISERRFELAHDFAHVGDRQAAIDAANGMFDDYETARFYGTDIVHNTASARRRG